MGVGFWTKDSNGSNKHLGYGAHHCQVGRLVVAEAACAADPTRIHVGQRIAVRVAIPVAGWTPAARGAAVLARVSMRTAWWRTVAVAASAAIAASAAVIASSSSETAAGSQDP
jgi:hypothetical protein